MSTFIFVDTPAFSFAAKKGIAFAPEFGDGCNALGGDINREGLLHEELGGGGSDGHEVDGRGDGQAEIADSAAYHLAVNADHGDCLSGGTGHNDVAVFDADFDCRVSDGVD